MAKLIVQNTLNNTSDYPNTFVRTNAFPLERYSIFDTIDGAKDYARNNPIAYIGQQLIVATSETETPSSFIISGGGELVRIPDVYDLTSASDSLTADLSDHASTSATTDTFGHVKLSNNEVLANYGTIATNANGQLVAPIATASTYGVVKACSNTSQPEGSPQHVIGLDTNGCVVLNIAKTHSGFNIVGENAPGQSGANAQKTILKVNTGTHPNSSAYHPTTNESSTVITNNNGQLAVYPASANHYGVVKIGTNLSNTDYSVVPNCSSVNAAITSLSGTVNNKFLPLSGGIVTGSLTIQGTNNYISQLDFGGSAAEAGLKVRGISGRLHDSPEKGSLFLNFDSVDVSHEDYWTYDTDDGRGVFICGKGNYSLAVRKIDLIAYSSNVSSAIETKISNEYLPLSGGTLTGNVGIGISTPTEKLHVDGGIKSTALSSDSAKINNTLSIGHIDISNGIINGIKRLEFPDSIIIGTNIEDNSSNVIHIEANGNKVFDGDYGRHASLIINGDGLTITHQLSSESGWEEEPSKVTITANTLDKLNHIDSIVTSGSVNLIQSGAVYDFIHGDTVSIGSTTNTPSGTIEIVAIENELQNKLAVSSNGLTLAHPVSSSNENDEVVYSQDEVTLTTDELKRIKNIENLKSTMVVREWDYTSTLPETTMTNNTMMIFRNWDLGKNDLDLDLIDEKLETI